MKQKIVKKCLIIAICIIVFSSLSLVVGCTKRSQEINISKIEILNAPQQVKLSDKNVTLTVSEEFRNETLVWKSSNSDIISVENGKLTLNSVGICNITVSLSSNVENSSTVKIKVVDDSQSHGGDDTIELLKSNKIENNDGLFEINKDWEFAVKDGDISLYSPELVKTEEGWANKNTFTVINEDGINSLYLESAGSHNYDILYVKFNRSIKKDAKYNIDIDFDWLGELDGNFGYMILSGENIDYKQVDYTVVSQKSFFNDKQRISFVAQEDAECFYLYFREGDGVNSDACHFRIKINSIALSMELRIKSDGTFEGELGCISLYTPDDKEIPNYTWMSETYITPYTEGGNTSMKIESNLTHEWSGLFIKFDLDILKNKKYVISFDAKWLGEDTATGFYYCVSADVASDNYQPIQLTELFADNVQIEYSTNKDKDYIYLKIINNNSTNFNFLIDNIKIEIINYETENDYDTLVEESKLL